MKKFFVLAAMAVACASASAQFLDSNASSASASTVSSDGWSTLYLQYNPMTFDADGGDLDFTGFTFGFNRAISLSSSTPLFIEVGGALTYAYYSEDEDYGYDYDYDYDYGYDYDGTEYKVNVWSLKVPVSLTYDWQVADKISILPYAGLTFRYNLAGKYKVEYDGDEIDANLFDDDEMGDSAFKRFQIGWQIGVNAKFNKFLVGLSYGSDFSEIADDCKIKTTSITIGCCF